MNSFEVAFNKLVASADNLREDSQPECYLQDIWNTFIDYTPTQAYKNALRVAAFYKQIFGDICVSREYSFCRGKGKIFTIIEAIRSMGSDLGEPGRWLLEHAFIEVGIQPNSSVDPRALRTIYMKDRHYSIHGTPAFRR